MLRRLLVVFLALGTSWGCCTDLLACGDKFLVPGRGVRYGGWPPVREAAAILIFVRPGSALEATFTSSRVEATLRSAGYRPTLVKTPRQFSEALVSGAWDVVVVDLADAGGLSQAGASSGPLVLPVAYDVTRASLAEAKRMYRRVLAEPAKSRPFVDAVDALIARRASKARALARRGL
jgi:hypothetical protein